MYHFSLAVRIHCVFSSFNQNSSRRKFYDPKNLCFWIDFGAEDEGRLTPFKDDNPKNAENTVFRAGSDNSCQASAVRLEHLLFQTNYF